MLFFIEWTQEPNYSYLSPEGTITFSLNTKYNVPVVDTQFDGWFENSFRLLPKNTRQRDRKGHLYRHQVFPHVLTVVLTLLFSVLKMAENNLAPIAPRPPCHLRERFPLPATQILQSKPEIKLQHGRFFITVHEFEARVDEICFQLWELQAFAKLVTDNYSKDILSAVSCICFQNLCLCF